MSKPPLQERLIRALQNCVDALDDLGHSEEMNRAMSGDRTCWKCQAVATAAELLRDIGRSK